MQLTKTKEELRQALAPLRSGRIGFVPTMGALHAGHASLIELAGKRSDSVVVSVFVNPTQFGPNEDFGKYPRMLEADVALAEKAGAAVVYAPSAEDMYPAGFATSVSAGAIGAILDGAFRPGHFDGVATVVAKLLLRVAPNFAVFGEKDYQQLCVIRRIVTDLDIPVEIIGAPTMREKDGLAMSSRNAYLSTSERQIAPALHDALVAAAKNMATMPPKAAITQAIDRLTAMGFKLDYMELRAADTLEPLEKPQRPARLLAAAWLGKTRLIDNIAI